MFETWEEEQAKREKREQMTTSQKFGTLIVFLIFVFALAWLAEFLLLEP